MGFQILFIIFFIMIWYLALIVETYSYLKKNKIGFSFLGIIYIPLSLFTLHLKMFHKEKSFPKKIRYLTYYFINYKLSVIFLTELLLENIAMTADITVKNQSDFGKLVDKKDIATAKFMLLMERRARHAGIKQLKANIDAEITERDGGSDSTGKEVQADKIKEKPNVREVHLEGYTKESINDEVAYHLNTNSSNYSESEYKGSQGIFTKDSIDEINKHGNTDLTKQLKAEFQKNPDSIIQPESTLNSSLRYNAYENGYGKEYYNEILKNNNDKEEKKLIKSLKKELDPSFKIKGQTFYQLKGNDFNSKINIVLSGHFKSE